MARRLDWVEIEGFATRISSAGQARVELYLHAAAGTFRVQPEAPPGEGVPVPFDDLPLGPRHRLRVVGRVTSGGELPTLVARRVDVIEDG